MFDKEIPQNDYAILAPKDEEGVEVTEDDKITEQLK